MEVVYIIMVLTIIVVAVIVALSPRLGFLSLLFLSFTTTATGSTFYVSKTGNDNNTCTQAQTPVNAKISIKAALSCVGLAGTDSGAGQTVEVGNGTYRESLVDVLPSGTTTAPFTLKCVTDFSCVLDPGGTNAGLGFNRPSHWIVISGFKIISGSGMYSSAYTSGTHHDISFVNNEIDGTLMDSGAMGLQSSGSSNFIMRGNKIHNLNGGNGYSHAIYAADFTNDWIIENNQIYSNGAYGIHLYGTENLPASFVVRNNIVYSNQASGIIAYGNNHKFYNNLSHQNGYGGILLRSASGVVVYSNTVWKNREGGIYNDYATAQNAICRNNLALENGSGGVRDCSTQDHNVTSGTGASYFVNTEYGDFKLLSSNGKGAILGFPYDIDIIGTPRTTVYDVGAYQYPSLSKPNAPTNLLVE